MEDGDGRDGSRSDEGLRQQWRGGTLVAAAVDLGQDDGELGGDDEGEMVMVKMKMTAPPLFIDIVARDSCGGSDGRSRNGAPLDA